MLEFAQPKGWIDVPLDNVGGGEDGKTLRAFLVQVRIVENHQNGKDTHVRGLKIYAFDERVGRAEVEILGEKGGRKKKDESEDDDDQDDDPKPKPKDKGKGKGKQKDPLSSVARAWLLEPDWMGEPTLR